MKKSNLLSSMLDYFYIVLGVIFSIAFAVIPLFIDLNFIERCLPTFVLVLLLFWWLLHLLISISCFQVLLECLWGDNTSLASWKALMYTVGKNELWAVSLIYVSSLVMRLF